MSAPFPVIVLQPVCDRHGKWTALLLDIDYSAGAPDGLLVQRLWQEFGLQETLGALSCVLALPTPDVELSGLPGERFVLCLPPSVCGDSSRHDTFAALRASGFRLMSADIPAADAALDDNVGSIAMACPEGGTSAHVTALLGKLPGPHLARGGKKMDCPGHCKFSWFSGGYDIHPHMATVPVGKNDPPNHTLLLELLAAVAKEADSHNIENIVKRDPQLSYHLLKLVNSVAFGQNKKISSFGQAITLLGRRQLQRWLQLLLYARSSKAGSTNPLMVRAAFRAGMMEALCREMNGSRDAQDRAFMTGMFSLLDELLGIPLTEVVKPLNLTDDVLAALLEHGGSLGVQLEVAAAAEHESAERCAVLVDKHGIDHESWARALIGACRWAEQVGREN